MNKNEKEFPGRSECSISKALEMIGDRWSLLILRDLMFTEKRSYSELQSSDEKIATNILASRLVDLVTNGLVRKSVDETNRRKMLYHLTEKGIDLLPVILELREWMEKYDTSSKDNLHQRVNNGGNKDVLLEELKVKLRKEHLF
jgi:DNA-binding HxlR family transcriptional regulator